MREVILEHEPSVVLFSIPVVVAVFVMEVVVRLVKPPSLKRRIYFGTFVAFVVVGLGMAASQGVSPFLLACAIPVLALSFLLLRWDVVFCEDCGTRNRRLWRARERTCRKCARPLDG